MNSPIPSASILAAAPAPLQDAPQPCACLECGRPVEPLRTHGGWFALARHRDCRSLHEARIQALEGAAAAADAIASGERARYRGLSIERTVTLRDGDPGKQRDNALEAGMLLRHQGNLDALRTLRAWTAGQGVVLEGPPGTGKTAMLLAFAQDRARTIVPGLAAEIGGCQVQLPRLCRVRYWSAADLAEELHARDKERGTDPIEWALSGDAIIIDDVGAERLAGYRRDEWEGHFAAVIDRGYSRRSPLLIATNLSEAQLIERYPGPGQRLVSRLVGLTGGGQRWIKVGGVDWRGLA